jgi:hypothetical protein
VYCLSYDSKLKQNEGRGAKKNIIQSIVKGNGEKKHLG